MVSFNLITVNKTCILNLGIYRLQFGKNVMWGANSENNNANSVVVFVYLRPTTDRIFLFVD
jgi:hypothetical protein